MLYMRYVFLLNECQIIDNRRDLFYYLWSLSMVRSSHSHFMFTHFFSRPGEGSRTTAASSRAKRADTKRRCEQQRIEIWLLKDHCADTERQLREAQQTVLDELTYVLKSQFSVRS